MKLTAHLLVIMFQFLVAHPLPASYLDEVQAPYLKDKFERREFHLAIERQVKEAICPSQELSNGTLAVINPYQVPPSIHLKFSRSVIEGQPPTYIVGSHALRDPSSDTYYFLAVKNKIAADDSEKGSSLLGETSLHFVRAKMNNDEAVLNELPIELPLKKQGATPSHPDAQDINRAESVFDSFIKRELSSGTSSLVASRQVDLCHE